MLSFIQKIFKALVVMPLDFITKYFKSFVFLFVVLLVFSTKESTPKTPPNLARLYLNGAIFSTENFEKEVNKILKTPSIKGVLLLIDSPGGAVSASVELSEKIFELRQKIPVLAYARGIMASGSYYVGMQANEVYASKASLIGSIGVIFSGANAENLLNKIGLGTQGVHAGEYKEIGTFTRAWKPNEKDFLQNLVNEQYQMFVNDVAKARNLNANNYKNFAEGKVFNAQRALDLRLIDRISTIKEAQARLMELSKVKEVHWLEKSSMERFIEKATQSVTSILTQAFSYQLLMR
ncbi:signal peptide peptidase SppA [Helicobacter cetorum]|uniref:Protease IV n=1 Tax=Helicobacter cetorum (strain ATCC BAA-540 / CCUG 52418 / MIT 99-5656) TaxID=1163745 RepID=I0EQI4_HELCM|nr:signal peptide peptidase SppA [Helicobacter cetorum]AFI05203.1 protease IV [Helicobacter cetorum MIT 99-5656]